MPSVSVIIPCFNHGKYLLETIESVRPLRDNGTAEVLIINDGSSDKHTLNVIAQLQNENWRILSQKNLGLAEARNNGIKSTSGKYILPLDSDNIIIPSFVNKAIEILNDSPAVDIVYSDSEHFGDSNFLKHVGDFDPCKLINDNYIDACAIFRRSVWEDVKGYDKDLPYMGVEDWDFWISAIMQEKNFCYVPMQGFKYRVRQDSMLNALTDEKGEVNRKYIYSKYNFQLLNSIRMNYMADSEKYKQKYYRQLESLNSRRLKNIIKLLIGKQFG